jgi:hypothetical protein
MSMLERIERIDQIWLAETSEGGFSIVEDTERMRQILLFLRPIFLNRPRFLRNQVSSGMFSHRPNKIGKWALAA